jgi:hypothetical protein
LDKWAGEPAAWLGNEPVEFFVFAGESGLTELSFRTKPGPALPGTPHRTLRLSQSNGTVQEYTVEIGERTTVCFRLNLPRGVSRLVLQCTDRPTVAIPNEPQRKLLGIIAPKLTRIDSASP